MLRRKIADEEDARTCLRAAEASGLPRKEWARREGIDGRSLNVWRLILARRGRGATGRGVGGVPFKLVELIANREPRMARYVIRCGSFAVEVDGGFDDGCLRRLLGVVAGC